MNFLQQFEAVFNRSHPAVAKLKSRQGGAWLAHTINGNHPVLLFGDGYEAGQTVFYDQNTGRIIETAPDLPVADVQV